MVNFICHLFLPVQFGPVYEVLIFLGNSNYRARAVTCNGKRLKGLLYIRFEILGLYTRFPDPDNFDFTERVLHSTPF